MILSTHSPILLGDVPQQNVIYLKRDLQSGGTVVDNAEHAGTFGQNIHMLFKDSFFLEHGTMGHFAQRKIKELLERLYQIEKRLEDAKKQKNRQGIEQECRWILQNGCRTCAELIAEPIIRRKLFSQIEMLTEKASQENTADELGQLSDVEIEKRIERLQKEQNRRRSGRKK